MAAVVVLTRDLETELTTPLDRPLSPRTLTLVQELRSWGREVRADRFEPILRRRLEAALDGTQPLPERLRRAVEVLDLADAAGLTLDLWEVQNRFSRLVRTAAAPASDALTRSIGERLHFNMERVMAPTGTLRG